jgi:hypothetical protein
MSVSPLQPDSQSWKDRLLGAQRRYNEKTRALWEPMSAHRQRVTREILRIGGRGRLRVFGAGNCNDLDLPLLVEAFESIDLVDVDAAAVEGGLRGQGLQANERIHVEGGVDFSGLSRALANDARDVQTFVGDLAEGIRQSFPGELPQADVVVSTCVLSQLIEGVAIAATSEGDPRERAVAVRDQHMDLLLGSTASRGSALLVADLVSSDTAPELRTCPDAMLSRLRDQLIARHNYFHGTNPHAIEQTVTRRHAATVARLERRPPWKWSLGERVFLVNALRMERR